MKSKAINKQVLLMAIGAVLVISLISVALIVWAGDGGNTTKLQSNSNEQNPAQQSSPSPTVTTNAQQAVAEADYDVASSLQYLIEEEKMAHDVYVYMYGLYGQKTFNNISASETTHQNKVLSLLESRDIPDPRIDAAGKYANQELQDLYNQLIAQGSQSLTEAYKVGVAIEERDIADLQAEINRTTDQEIITVLTSLKNASEKHLKAFNSHL